MRRKQAKQSPKCAGFGEASSPLAFLLVAGVVAITGCSGGTPSDASPASPVGQAPAPPSTGVSTKDCTLPTCPAADPILMPGVSVSFKRDLMLPLQRNCSDVPCHGSRNASGGAFYLSEPSPAAVSASDMLSRMVRVASKTAAGVPLIEPGDPTHSFLVAKVEGCQSSLNFKCTAQPRASASSGACGDTMPQGQRPLCNQERSLLRLWILAGAEDN